MKNYTRREFLQFMSLTPVALAGLKTNNIHYRPKRKKRPNILLLMSDNHSWNHLGCYGDPVVKTPNIDAVASRGVRFTQAFCAAPSCSPARAGMLTGQDIWRLEEGANLWGVLPDKFPCYTDMLEVSGYHVGIQGKGWGPGSVKMSGRGYNHGGRTYESFDRFLEANNEDKPFCYWLSSPDPHRPFTEGAGVKSDMNLSDVEIPSYLPDNETIRRDICDYYYDIEHFDHVVGQLLERLKKAGEYENTVIVICSDNGWQMPRGLANLYDSGTRIPLIIAWPGEIPGGRVVDDPVNLNDLAPTFLELAGEQIPESMTATSLTKLLFTNQSGKIDPGRDAVYTARERHALCRQLGMGYPGRAIRTRDYLYIRNYEPDRWPAGDPPLFGDVDAHMLHYPCPTKMYMLTHRDNPDVRPLYEKAFLKREAEELYDLNKDPFQMNNCAGQANYQQVRRQLSQRLDGYLLKTGDPRATGEKVIWDTTMYYQSRDFIAEPGAEAIKKLGLKKQYNYFDLQDTLIKKLSK
ncbi:MAG: sulfatase-like hydrolase/transferase [Bacteroidales bacterium]